MSNQTSRKSLWMALLVAVMVLAMVVCFAGCNNEQAESQTTAPATTVGADEAERVDLYWNLDRALYDGMSEAGMSSREPGEDGYFHVRFFKDGEIVELRVADRKAINAMEVQDLMGLEFDEDGLVVGIIPVDDLPIEKLAWQFYVQSVGGKLVKTNSSASLNGMEILLETDENTGIWDMTGLSGDVGCKAEAMQLDRIMALGDADGNVTHIFIYERPNYMKTHEGECEHCEKTVTWYEWTKENSLPINGGHYQLMVDLSGVKQASMVEDAKICVDLNGHRVDGASGARIYSLHNAGTELAIMDTSEAKTGRIAAHGQGDQGMCVWLRYGVFYLYDGILDASDAKTYLNGPCVNMGSNTYFYMHGGELIGGTADTKSNGKGGYTGGVGGTLFIGANSKFVMNDGMIRDGYAKAKITKYDANGKPTGYSCGSGGNIFANTGAVIELNGGTIRDGRAVTYGNIYLGSKAEMTMNAGLIAGGSLYYPSSNGGNIGVGTNANFVMNGGTIRNGRSYNCGGNIYLNGRFQMNDGIITDGKILKWGTKDVIETSASRNVFSVNGDFYMYGGRVAGGFQCIDTDAKSNETILVVSARSVIFDEDGTGPHLTLSNTAGGGICKVMVGQMHNEGKIGVSAVQTAIFTEPTKEHNTDNFISDIPDADIGWTAQGLSIGKTHCLCSQDPEIADDAHMVGCDKVMYAWAPWTSTSSLPNSAGNWYLVNDVKCGNTSIVTNGQALVDVKLDLNGHTITQTGGRMYSLFENSQTYLEDGVTIAPDIVGEAIHLTLTDTKGGATVNFNARSDADQGQLVWGRWTDSKVSIFGGTYNCQNVASLRHNGVVLSTSGELNIYGGTFNGGSSVDGGIISGNKINIYGGTISGGKASRYGGNIYSKGTVNIYGGTITGGQANGVDLYAQGGNIWMSGSNAVLNIDGNAVISNGTVTTKKGTETWAPGGNIYVNGGATVTIDGGAEIFGGKGSEGHNLYMTGAKTTAELRDCTLHNANTSGSQQITVEGGTLTVDGATISNENANCKNIATNESGTNVGNIVIKSGTITGGSSNGNGGNIYIGQNDTLTVSGGLITDGYSKDSGGNIACYGKMTMTGGTVRNGIAGNPGNGMNISMIYSIENAVTEFTMTGGTIAGGMHFNNFKGYVKVNISGNPVIDKSLATANAPTYSVPLYGNIFNVGTMKSGAKIMVTGNGGLFTTPVSSNYTNYFISEQEGTSVFHTAEGLFLGKAMCACGGKAVGVGDHKCENVLWQAWDGSSTSAQKLVDANSQVNLYLTKDATISNQINIAAGKRVNIDLNGHTLTATWRLARVYSTGKLGVTNTGDSNGKVVFSGPNNDHSSVLVQDSGEFNLYAGTLTMSATSTNKVTGSAILGLSSSTKFNMYGGTISGGRANGHAGNIGVSGSAVMHMYAGTITGGTTNGGNGGNIRVSSGASAYIHGGTVSNGVSSGVGGNFDVAGGFVEISGGTISGGSTKGGNGGNFNVSGNGTLTVKGGTITDGYSPDSGGNIVCYGTLNVSGGTITNGKSGNPGNGMNISIVCSAEDHACTFNLSGGTIAGGVHFNNFHDYVKVNVSGNPIVDKELATANKPTYSMALTINKLNVGTMTSGAKIMVSGREGVFTNAVAENYTNYFISETDGYAVGYSESGLIFGKGMCACGGKAVGVGDHTCKTVVWQPWDGDSATAQSLVDSNSQVNLYLTKGASVGQINVKGGKSLNINLNGQTLTASWRLARVYETGKLGITDTVGTGKVVFKGPNNDHSSILMGDTATVNLYAGTLTRDTTSTNTVSVGGIIGVWGTFNMYGGTVSNGKTTGNGGCVYIGGGTMNMYKGTVSGGNSGKYGGNIYIASGSTLNMAGGTVSGGNATAGGNIMAEGTASITGGTVENGVSTGAGGNILAWGSKLDISNATISGGDGVNGGNICVDGSLKLTINNTTLKDGESDNGGGNILLWGSTTLTMTNSTLSGGNAKNGGNLSVGSKNSATLTGCTIENGTSAGAGGNILCYKELTLNNCTVTGGSVNTNGSDYAKGGNIHMSGSSVVVNINGGLIEKGTIDSGIKNWAPGGNICVDSGARLTVDGGARITGGNPLSRDADGNNIYITSDATVVTLKNCTVENTRGGGGNINVEKGTLNIEGATITNTATSASNIRTNGAGKTATINLKSGTISGGTNANIVLNEDDTLNITGGTITGGVSADDGGNIYMYKNSTLTMSGGTVSKGVAATNGGNIHISSGATATISGGTVTGGRARNGGNLRVNGTLNISGSALIEYGGATDGTGIYGGGNIFSPNGSTVNMSGGTIRNGGKSAYTDGAWGADSALNTGWTNGNVLNEGTFTMTGGLIVGTFNCWSNSKLNLSGDAKIYVRGNGLLVGGTVTLGKVNIGETPSFTIFTNKTNAPTPKKIATLASDVTYTEEELNKLFLGWAWDDTSIQFTFYLNGNEVWMKKAE